MTEKNTLPELIKKVQAVSLPAESELFSGANLIISGDPNRSGYEQDVVVLSEDPNSLSWLVFELKKVFSGEINASNKHSFFSGVGMLMIEAEKKGFGIREQMQYVLHHLSNMKRIDELNLRFGGRDSI